MTQRPDNRRPSLLGDLAQICLSDSERWFGDIREGTLVYDVPFLALCMAGEAGEFANVVKKIYRGSLDMKDASTRIKLTEELTDTFVYLLNLAGALGIDLAVAFDVVRGQNEVRFTAARLAREQAARRKALQVVEEPGD